MEELSPVPQVQQKRKPPQRKKRSGLCLSRRSRYKESGAQWQSVMNRRADQEVRRAAREVSLTTELRQELHLKTKECKRTAKKLKKSKQEVNDKTAELKKAKRHCERYCVTLPHVPKKDFKSLCAWRQKKVINQFLTCLEDLSSM